MSKREVQWRLWICKDSVTLGYDEFHDKGAPVARGGYVRDTQTESEGSSLESGMGRRHHQESLEENRGHLWPFEPSPDVAPKTMRNFSLFLSPKVRCPSKRNLAGPKPSRTCCQQIQI